MGACAWGACEVHGALRRRSGDYMYAESFGFFDCCVTRARALLLRYDTIRPSDRLYAHICTFTCTSTRGRDHVLGAI